MTTDRRDWLIVISSSAAFVAALWVSGWTTPWISPDTNSYLAIAPYPEFYFQQRLPFYGWLVALLGGQKFSFTPVVWLHLVLHTLAASVLYFGIRRLDAGKAAATALFLAAMLSQGFLVFGRSIAPEAPAVSLTLIAMSATLLAVPGEHWKRYLVLAAIAGAAACLLRPTMLPLVVMLPVLFVLATRITGRKMSVVRIVVLQLALLFPLLVYTAERARHTGDFRLVAFGGFQMSGMAGLLLSTDVVQRFPIQDRELAVQVLTAREHAEAAGRVLRTPLNSMGERSFVSAAVGYFDIYARTYDDLLYGEIIKLRSPEESWVDFDRRLQRFALITIMLAPERYAAWVVGASSRLVGHMILTNAPFILAGLGLLAAILLVATGRPASIRNLTGSTDMLLVVAVVATYIFIAAPLAVLITFPASRYIDTAAHLLPALPLFGAIRLAAAYSRSSPS
jgi:Dolichyl-phosphate-mannose-protein mannosyltransferase